MKYFQFARILKTLNFHFQKQRCHTDIIENTAINLLSVIRYQLNLASFQPQWIKVMKCKASSAVYEQFSPNLRAKGRAMQLNLRVVSTM